VILLRIPILIVDFLSNQEQDAVSSDPIISLHTLNQHIVIRHDNRIQTGFNGGVGDILVRASSIREAGMHVQIDDNFVHGSSIFALTAIRDGVSTLQTASPETAMPAYQNSQVDGSSSTRV
jgi:hypothetical protein